MSTIKIAIATNSLGKSAAGHTIHRKLQAAKAHGFDGLEVAFECLEAHASTYISHQSRNGRLLAAAGDIYKLATSLGLELIALNPFGAYDGLKDPHDVEIRLQEAELWCQLCQVMHIRIFQVR
jgi:4-hydroxyphenylpyruvate dioxygenase